MSVWRRRAIETFPELRRDLNDRDAISTPYELWFELRPMAMTAHRERDDELLDRIYGYADWCSRQRSTNPSNSVAVSFHENLVDHPGHWKSVLSRLSDETIADVWGLWSARLDATKIDALAKLLRTTGRPVPKSVA